MGRYRLLAGLVGAFGVMVLVAPVSVGAASPSGGSGESIALLGNTTLDLSNGWGLARACLVWRQGGVLECFTSEAGLAQREAELRPLTAGVGLLSLCSSSLDLYSGSSYTGLHLALWDEAFWINLAGYGFDKLTVSFAGGACSFHLAQGAVWGRLVVAGLHRPLRLFARHGSGLEQHDLVGVHRVEHGRGGPRGGAAVVSAAV